MKNKKPNSDLEFISRIESANCWRVIETDGTGYAQALSS
jgi:hypothetical protein